MRSDAEAHKSKELLRKTGKETGINRHPEKRAFHPAA